MRFYLLSIILLICQSLSYAQKITYELAMSKPQNHYYEVTMVLEDFKEESVEVKMPIWAPGSYLAREFAKNVNLVKGYDGNGKELEIRKTDKNTWKVIKGSAKKVRIEYEVYAFELSVRTSFLDLTHGFVSSSGVFMYVNGHKDQGGKVVIFPHEQFKTVTTALKEVADGVVADGRKEFTFDNYDQLADCPIEIGNQEVFYFNAAGVKHTVAMYNFGNYDVEALKVDMSKIVEAATDVFGQNPNKEYTFIIHNVVDAQGGLEHTNSTVLSVNRWTYSGDDYIDFLQLVAHEYFHLWNVKRIRPLELGPFDYDHENYTSLLWVMEGFTSYYEKMILLKAGYNTDVEFLGSMFSRLNYVEGSVGARVQPVAHASFDAWIKAYRPTENSANTTMTYYSRGAVIAMVLDAMIIKQYNGKKTLDDFMRLLYKTYYEGKGRGFSETEFKKELEGFIKQDMDDFFAKYIDGTEIPDYNKYLEPVGVYVKYIGQAMPNVGLSLKSDGGKTIIRGIRANSPAEEAGLSVNDEIIGLNGFRVNTESLDSYMKSVQTGEIMNILFSRDQQLYSTEIVVTNYEQPKFSHRIKDDARSSVFYKAWMRGTIK